MNRPERPIQRTRKLRRVTHERAPIPKARVNEPAFNRLDAPVHHVARRDAVHARARIVDRDLCDARDGRLGVDRAVGVQHPAVPVRGVLAETDVRRDVDLWEERLDLSGCLDDGSVRVVGGGAALVLSSITKGKCALAIRLLREPDKRRRTRSRARAPIPEPNNSPSRNSSARRTESRSSGPSSRAGPGTLRAC